MPNSRRRALALASWRFATFAHARSRISATTTSTTRKHGDDDAGVGIAESIVGRIETRQQSRRSDRHRRRRAPPPAPSKRSASSACARSRVMSPGSRAYTDTFFVARRGERAGHPVDRFVRAQRQPERRRAIGRTGDAARGDADDNRTACPTARRSCRQWPGRSRTGVPSRCATRRPPAAVPGALSPAENSRPCAAVAPSIFR